MDRIFSAIEFAAHAHAGKFRKGTKIPYIIHPLSVAKILIERGCSENLAIAGVLHDTVEDTPVTLRQIQDRFGAAIADLVRGVSEPDKSKSWEERKQHTIECLQTAPMDVLLLSCADKLDNIRSIREDLARSGESVWKRFKRPREQQEWYYRSLAQVFCGRAQGEPSSSLFEEYRREVEQVFGL